MRLESAGSETATVVLTEREVVLVLNGLAAIPRSGVDDDGVLQTAAALAAEFERVLSAVVDAWGRE
jgi:hypothetical protein